MRAVRRWPGWTKSRNAAGAPSRTLVGKAGNVGAGGEGLVAATGQDDGAHRVVALDFVEQGAEAFDQFVIERIELAGAVERQQRDAVVDLAQDGVGWSGGFGRGLAGHRSLRALRLVPKASKPLSCVYTLVSIHCEPCRETPPTPAPALSPPPAKLFYAPRHSQRQRRRCRRAGRRHQAHAVLSFPQQGRSDRRLSGRARCADHRHCHGLDGRGQGHFGRQAGGRVRATGAAGAAAEMARLRLPAHRRRTGRRRRGIRR